MEIKKNVINVFRFENIIFIELIQNIIIISNKYKFFCDVPLPIKDKFRLYNIRIVLLFE